MDLGTWILFGLVAVIGANQVVVRLPAVRRDRRWFWGINALDALVAGAVLTLGLPGLPPVAAWVVGLLLLLHVAQNLHLKATWDREDREEAIEEQRRERDRQRALREAEEAAGPEGT